MLGNGEDKLQKLREVLAGRRILILLLRSSGRSRKSQPIKQSTGSSILRMRC
jgi:hypothetical protein